jgi:putative flippase GtrA
MIDAAFILKLLKFCIVGTSGVVVDFGATWLLKERLRVNRYVSNSCGLALASASNYALNRLWTFQSHNPHIVTEYLHFLAIALVGLAINTLVLWLLSDRARWRFYPAKLCATGVVTGWNFGMNYVVTFG